MFEGLWLIVGICMVFFVIEHTGFMNSYHFERDIILLHH